jgi:biopolymer transport protein ExbB
MFMLMQKGGFVMYPLLVCSLISLTFIIERILFWIRQNKGRNQEVVNRMLHLVEKGRYEEISQLKAGSTDYVARMLFSGILHREFSLKDALEMAAEEEIKRMQKHLIVLDTIITLSPLLGILGTVLGIIHSFDLLGSTGIDHPQAVSAGIAQALLTTATGLAIAIFTLIPYNYFQSRVEKAVRLLEKYGTSLKILWDKQNSAVTSKPKTESE